MQRLLPAERHQARPWLEQRLWVPELVPPPDRPEVPEPYSN
jgi:hypothetical protein